MWMNMEIVLVGVVTFVTIWISHWIWRWMNPKSNGILPPGSMGLPLIGETISLLWPSYSLDLHSFYKKRIQRYGPIFKTSIAGRPVVISADPELNSYLFQQEGKLVELWYLDSVSKLFGLDSETRMNASGSVHKYVRSIYLGQFGVESLKKLIPHIEEAAEKTLNSWSTHDSVEIKRASSVMAVDFTAKHTLNYDPEDTTCNIADSLVECIKSLLSFPVNIPGTRYNKTMKVIKSLQDLVKAMLNERRDSPELARGDMLDQLSNDIGSEKYLTEDFMVNLVLVGIFIPFETLSSFLALAFKLFSDHPLVVEEMIVEHESILKKREDPNSSLTWEEYKSMSFTSQVINEILRINSASILLRRALQDIPAKGFTIPKGWGIMLHTPPLHFNHDIYENPLDFNPWRWKTLTPQVVSTNFMPFGGGVRQCAGSEYSKVFIATLFHVMLTKYSWKTVKMGKIYRSLNMQFGEGIHVKFSKKQNDEK